MTKQCRVCGVEHPLAEFRNRKMYKNKSYYSYICRSCDNARRKAHYFKDPERERWKCIKRLYGITQEQWLAVWAAQGECCGCCGATEPGGRRRWQTDHDHETGRFRGILCLNCNLLIGRAQDDPARLNQAIAYLERGR